MGEKNHEAGISHDGESHIIYYVVLHRAEVRTDVVNASKVHYGEARCILN